MQFSHGKSQLSQNNVLGLHVLMQFLFVVITFKMEECQQNHALCSCLAVSTDKRGVHGELKNGEITFLSRFVLKHFSLPLYCSCVFQMDALFCSHVSQMNLIPI